MIALLRRHLRAALERRLGLPTIPLALDRLKQVGFNPPLVFDVGAYRGDFARLCLARWPDAGIACFDPQRSMGSALRALAAETAGGRFRVFPVLLGAGERESVVLHEVETASSVLREKAGPDHPAAHYRMTTVDRVVADHYGG